MTAITDKQDKIKEFIFDGRVPFDNRLFFIQHLKPYDFFFASCKGKRVLERALAVICFLKTHRASLLWISNFLPMIG
jgi:hypothetical protein